MLVHVHRRPRLGHGEPELWRAENFVLVLLAAPHEVRYPHQLLHHRQRALLALEYSFGVLWVVRALDAPIPGGVLRPVRVGIGDGMALVLPLVLDRPCSLHALHVLDLDHSVGILLPEAVARPANKRLTSPSVLQHEGSPTQSQVLELLRRHIDVPRDGLRHTMGGGFPKVGIRSSLVVEKARRPAGRPAGDESNPTPQNRIATAPATRCRQPGPTGPQHHHVALAMRCPSTAPQKIPRH
mmetsp:Transcript_151023/g.383888  ORF Transcript_151023/g.383888 Transcript_151023/m.383888 type:complete len:240 (-) Transcript_151023:13-732(-)